MSKALGVVSRTASKGFDHWVERIQKQDLIARPIGVYHRMWETHVRPLRINSAFRKLYPDDKYGLRRLWRALEDVASRRYHYRYRYVSLPGQRGEAAAKQLRYRRIGELADDRTLSGDWMDPINARAHQLMPPELRVGRARRIEKGVYLENYKLAQPIENQNYDPWIPYFAPYYEEAKFHIQEEHELLSYEPYERHWTRENHKTGENYCNNSNTVIIPGALSKHH